MRALCEVIMFLGTCKNSRLRPFPCCASDHIQMCGTTSRRSGEGTTLDRLLGCRKMPRTEMNLTQDPHRRLNALTNEWILVSPHRTSRPWQGEVAKLQTKPEPAYDPNCYLCPGNARVGGVRNPQYPQTFVFQNDFAALKQDTPKDRIDIEDRALLVAEGEPGICRVICFSPRHDLTLATMTPDQIEPVVRS